MQSIYSRPSASQTKAPFPRTITTGRLLYTPVLYLFSRSIIMLIYSSFLVASPLPHPRVPARDTPTMDDLPPSRMRMERLSLSAKQLCKPVQRNVRTASSIVGVPFTGTLGRQGVATLMRIGVDFSLPPQSSSPRHQVPPTTNYSQCKHALRHHAKLPALLAVSCAYAPAHTPCSQLTPLPE